MKYISTKYLNKRHFFAACFIMLISNSLHAEKSLSPEQIEGATRVSAEGVIELIERIDDLIIVDSRIKGDRYQGYIESSISLPDTKTNCKSLLKIIPTYHSPALFYCNGVKCGRSVVAIKIAKACGFTQLYWFRGGFEEWMKKGFPFIAE